MELIHAPITKAVQDAAYRVHSELGPGLLESTYEMCMYEELTCAGLQIARQVEVPVLYRGKKLDCGYRIDLLVENKVVIELKSIAELLPVHESQLLTYLRLGRYRVGFLINFNVQHLKDGIVRRVL